VLATISSGGIWNNLPFQVSGSAPIFNVLWGFSSSLPDLGEVPNGLAQGPTGLFYGTYQSGGDFNLGGLFAMTPSGGYLQLHSFAETDDSDPAAGLTFGSDGNFYGTTYLGGAYSSGTIFKLSQYPSTTFTHLYGFDSVGAQPYGLIQATDGNFYGLCYSGCANDKGSIFRFAPDTGAVTMLYAFTGGADGENPIGSLFQAADGNLYGATYFGGGSHYGTVFQYNLGTRALTTIFTFSAANGTRPRAGVVQAEDGNLYGTTSSGGIGGALTGHGAVYGITTAGALMVLHKFTAAEGSRPMAPLMLANDGNLYGTTSAGASGYGTVFQFTTAGTLRTLHKFALTDGSTPLAPLVQGIDGILYGTTTRGAGKNLSGDVFRLNLNLLPFGFGN